MKEKHSRNGGKCKSISIICYFILNVAYVFFFSGQQKVEITKANKKTGSKQLKLAPGSPRNLPDKPRVSDKPSGQEETKTSCASEKGLS